MARLLRLHLTCVGHPDARFSPLTLDFRGPDGVAANTVLWLRNGGGKSSLLNLFYSTFIPQTTQFLGKKSDGSRRKLPDYVQSRDLACVVSEWDMSSGRERLPEIRIIGQIMSWKDAVAAPHDESRLERCFFTFRTNEEVNFETLPVFGLRDQPVVSLTLFKDWLNWLKTEHRALEAESRAQKGEWVRVLADVGFDEDLFKYQLVMNGREGGADELFRVKSADEFIELFLEMAYSPQQANETAKTLEGVREKLRKLPQHQLEERFILELTGTLLPLESAARELDDAAKKLDAQRQQNFLLHAAIQKALEVLGSLAAAAKEEVASVEREQAEAKQKKLKLQEYRLNYDYLAKELAVLEAEAALKLAQSNSAEAERRYRVALAAEAFVALLTQEARLKGLRETRDKLLAEQKPELDALRAAGANFAAALTLAENAARGLLSTAQSRFERLDGDRKSAEARLTSLVEQAASAKKDFEHMVERLSTRDRRRAELRDARIVEHHEKGSAALTRLEAERDAKKNEAAELDAVATESEKLADDSRKAADAARTKQHEHAEKAKEHGQQVTRGEVEATALSMHRCVREVMESDTPDLEFEPLADLLRKSEAERLRRIIAAELDVADDRRAEKSIESDHLLPPSRDVDVALEFLRTQQVLSAMPAYRFLSQNQRQVTAAEERLRSDPARFSGIMVNRPEDMEKLRSRSQTVPGLRHPVAVSLTGFHDAAAVPDTLVLMPESAGAFHQPAAAAAREEIQFRLNRAAETKRLLEAERQEAAAVVKRLLDYRETFGHGALARMKLEHNLAREAADDAASKADAATEAERVHRASAAGQRAKAKEIREMLPSVAGGIERLRGYVQEFERHEDGWLARRGELQTKLDELKHAHTQLMRDKEYLEHSLDDARSDVLQRRAAADALAAERSAIQHRDEQPPTAPQPLEETRVLYRTLVDEFDKRFGGQKIDGQIEEAENRRAELESDAVAKRGSLESDEVELFASSGDVPARRESADRARSDARAEVTSAEQTLQTARSEQKPRAHKQGPGLPPDAPRPATAAEARERHAEMGIQVEELDAEMEAVAVKLNAAREESSRLDGSLKARKPLLTVLADGIIVASGPMPSLPDDDDALNDQVNAAKYEVDALSRTHSDAAQRVDALYDKLLAITRREEFHPLPLIVREKLAVLPKPELLARCHELKGGYEERQKVLRDEIESYTKDKDLVVRELHNVARNAHNLLGQAERASTMPETMSGWAGQSFLRIRSADMPEQTACRERLGLLVNRLVEEKAIPDGHKLAFAAVKEITGPFKVTVLKPQPVLSPHRHDIVDFSSFSGGERLTAAILLYTALAQLRARSRDGALRAREAGLLILDNPFGAASLREFVDLQQRVARQMGVQLIYATGVNDLGALEVFPRILRLRNAHLDRHTGNKLVTEESVSLSVQVAAANLRHE